MSANDKVALSIQGKEINYKFELIDINDLRFYRKNPRIATIIAENPEEITDESIDQILWNKNETHKLYRQIEKDGGLIHPVVVYKGEILEGNTRLCCFRHLFNETRDDKWKRIKCHVILDTLSQDQIYRLLCTEHIEGKIAWEAYEKANLYCKMKHEEGMSLERISEVAGESAPTINYRIKAYKLMIKNKIVDKGKYSHFEQLVRLQDFQEIKKRDPEVEEKVIELIKEEKIPTAQEVRLIPDIYKHKEARKRLFQRKESITQIYHDLKAVAPMTDSPFMKNVEELVKSVKKLKREERAGLEESKRDCAKIEELTKELIKLCKEINIDIHIPKKMQKK